MKTISRTFYKMPVNTMFMVLVPLFFFLFVLAYRPFNLDVFLAPGGQHYTLNLIICTLIVLGVMSLSRMLLSTFVIITTNSSPPSRKTRSVDRKL